MSVISVLIPVYNGQKFIESALKSLTEQSYKKFLVVICDDGSTDKSLEIVNAYKSKLSLIIMKNETNLGIPKTLTSLINAARNFSDIGVYLAQDDCFPPNYLQEIAKCFMRNNTVLVYTRLIKIDSDANRMKSSVNPPNINIFKKYKTLALINGNYVTAPGLAFRLNLFEDDMLFETNNLLHDWWQFLIYSTLGNFKICYSTNAYYRIHANNLSKSKTITSNDVGVFRNSFYNSRYFKSHLTKYTSLEKYFISKILPINVNNKEYYSSGIALDKPNQVLNFKTNSIKNSVNEIGRILNIEPMDFKKESIKTVFVNYLYTLFATIKMVLALAKKRLV